MRKQEEIYQWLSYWFSEHRSLPRHSRADYAFSEALTALTTSKNVNTTFMVVAFDTICTRYSMQLVPVHEIEKVCRLWHEAFDDLPDGKITLDF